MPFAVCSAIAVGTARANDAIVRAGRITRAGYYAATVETVGVTAVLARSRNDAVAGAFAIAVALAGIAMRFAAG